MNNNKKGHNYNLNTINIDYNRRSNSITTQKHPIELKSLYQVNDSGKERIINTIDYCKDNDHEIADL